MLTHGIVAGLLAIAGFAQPAVHTADIVATDRGVVRGTVDEKTVVFQGIPYAAPPTGNLRWQLPRPARAWSGVRPATAPGSDCPQDGDPVVGTPGSADEDCLFLNVTVPKNRKGPLPVMVWVHGGGFRTGSGAGVDERRLASEGNVIVVTINYRLGIFGFFARPGLAGSGTFGIADQQAALRWVQRNALAFGGNPRQVTIFGESAGGDGICALLTSPTAAGLFQRAIMQSGSCTKVNGLYVIGPGAPPEIATWKPLSTAENVSTSVSDHLGCADLACMREKDVKTLLAATQTNGQPVYWSPAFQTPVLPLHPADALTSKRFNRVPVMAGTTRDEGRFFTALWPQLSPSDYAGLLTLFGDKATLVGERYPLSAYVTARQAWGAIITDYAFACPNLMSHRWFDKAVPTYAYEFADRDAPPIFDIKPDFPLGAYHGSELAYLHDLARVSLTPQQKVLSQQMTRYWTRFAATGNPNAAGLPQWSRKTVQSLAPQAIGPTDFSADHNCDVWNAVYSSGTSSS